MSSAKVSERQQPAVVEAVKPSHISLSEGLDLSFVEEDSGRGVDSMSMADVAMPYLYILQANSPVVNPGASQFVEGAQAGMLYNNVSQEIYDGRKVGLTIIPCFYERKLVEWVDRDKGGGWVADYDVSSDIMSYTTKNDKGRPVMKGTGNLIVETAYHYCLFFDPNDGEWGQCVFPLKSSALKQNKKWNNDLVTTKIPGSQKIAPRWLFPYQLTTASQTKGPNTWWGPNIVRKDQTVTMVQYTRAKDFAELIGSGLIKRTAEVSPESASGVSEEHSEDIMPF